MPSRIASCYRNQDKVHHCVQLGLSKDITSPYSALHITGGDTDLESIPLDGMDVWNTISHGDPSPRKEILLNIDPLPFDNDDPSVSFYEGVALRSGHMKILMGVNNDTWYTPPELGGKSESKHVISPRRDQVLDLLASTKEVSVSL